MGHGNGAACINFLMVSPVAKGLFHRSILMAGSALSDWALANDIVQTTLKVAQDTNCPMVDDHDELLKCLRNKTFTELMSIKVPVSEFSTRFGPIIDGLVVPNAVHKMMGQFSDIFSRFVPNGDVLYFSCLSFLLVCMRCALILLLWLLDLFLRLYMKLINAREFVMFLKVYVLRTELKRGKFIPDTI